ncbi:MAG: hypothetical protein JSW26_08120 [Desulfobacterales bacterium]|nr:MAG: hypothetical protein JSW26_08120 [Desulfobacterales bacterium]
MNGLNDEYLIMENKDNLDEHLQGQLYPNLGTFALLEKLADSTEEVVRKIIP